MLRGIRPEVWHQQHNGEFFDSGLPSFAYEPAQRQIGGSGDYIQWPVEAAAAAHATGSGDYDDPAFWEAVSDRVVPLQFDEDGDAGLLWGDGGLLWGDGGLLWGDGGLEH